MHRLVAALAVFAFLAGAPVALADGVSYVSQGGLGVLARDGKTRYVALPGRIETTIERVNVHGGSVVAWTTLDGFYGIPAPTLGARGVEGLSRDGKELFVATGGFGPTTGFTVIGAKDMRVRDGFTLKGNFAYDALSPDAKTLYLVQHTDVSNINRYVVRAYDLQSHKLHAGAIADKSQHGWVMEGSAVTRTTSRDGRWVYTLYQRPGGYPFIHALDTVNSVAHCTGLPWHGDQMPLFTAKLTLGADGKTLAVRLKGGRTWLTMNTSNWRLTHVHQRPSATAFPWRWLLVGIGGAVALLVGLGSFAVVRRRQPREAVPMPL